MNLNPASIEDMKAIVAAEGDLLRREVFSEKTPMGWTIDRHRWAVYDKDMKLICHNPKPKGAFKLWRVARGK